jgi:hypothetical protein
LQKAAQKAEAAELKKMQKDMQKWEKGKFALKSIVADIDAKIVELGSVGGDSLSLSLSLPPPPPPSPPIFSLFFPSR